ncbi:hypothetical protein [Roseateles koreensis]|uniref:Oligosaccharide repeat unit polymerase n=1 Tax=Roseateles koreensis TaxID=2987526 RepID=A0ABT5KMG7_9BURK|nr:hypothetical protein [Roseateles koreensis]MDC8784106.1 hypothetical protein [Roseateles koreensis]
MNFIDEHLWAMLAAVLATAFGQLWLIRRYVNNIADPLVFFTLTSAFSLGLGSYATGSHAIYARILLYFFCFYLGFLLGNRRALPPVVPLKLESGGRHFKTIVVTSCLIFFLSNVIIWVQSGTILLSDDPSLQKSVAYEGGLGFIRRINWGLGVFALIAAIYWWLWERSLVSLICACVAMLTSFTGGGKSALLPLIFALGLYFLNPFQPARKGRHIPSRRLLVGALLLGAVPVAVVLLIEGDSPQAAIDALLVRLFFSGDILLYWGQPDLRAHFSYLGPIDYFRDSLGSVLGMLRMSDYATPIGNQFVQYSLPVGYDFSESLGPNLPFYVRGELYFGPWLAPIHAVFIGLIIGQIRALFVRYRGNSPLRYSLAAFAICLAGALPIEEGLAIGQVVDFLLVFGPIYALASLLQGTAARSRSITTYRANQKA